MNPEGVPLQGMGYGGYPMQPGGTTGIQSTRVNIDTEPPKDHIIWSLICFNFSNPCCLGLAALIYSVKSRDRKVVGDLEGARHYGSTARSLNIAATVLFFLICLIPLIIFAVTIIQSRNRFNKSWYGH
ncbi:dispanin subfamily A member 2b-like [Xyrichtys novacula]|uniref:Dispanin subfamily A member 2b-like n=1 Tax=Xyrichtys novacula TaxID=13765 RepID=A0AAV1F6S3_XYRNO|nr:dispanin subfamily A member 2b-like [Xyrichtys novacula]